MNVVQLAFALIVASGLSGPRAEQMAEYVVDASRTHRVGVALVAAVMHSESGFDGTRVGRIGELGISQLHPRYPMGRAYRSFRGAQDAKDRFSIMLGAEALRHGMVACGFNVPEAIGWYKSGRCVAGPRVKQVMIVRARITRLAGDA